MKRIKGATRDHLSVCALVPYPLDTVPGQRFRIEQWLSSLQEQGIEVDFLPFADTRLMQLLYQSDKSMAKAAVMAKALLRRIVDVITASRYDAILIHRTVCLVGPAWFERILRLSGKPIIFDFDDAIFYLHTAEANRKFGWLKFPGKTAAICRLSLHVVVGNAWLADYARQFNAQVTIVPSSVEIDRFQPVTRYENKARVIVGWTGSSTSQTYLEAFVPMLRELVTRYDVELRIHSDREPHLPGVPYVWRPWAAETEAEEIRQFDIGLMPMPDVEWAKGKCAMKALLYMALGVPAVCTAIGANCEVIQHDENGLLVKTDEEWLTNIGRLVHDATLRQRLGMAGRQTVEAKYSKQYAAQRFADVIHTTVNEWKVKQESDRWNPVSYKNRTR